MIDHQQLDEPGKKVFLLAAFSGGSGSSIDDRREGSAGAPGRPGPVRGMAEQVVAVIGIDGDRQRFEWVGDGPEDSVTNPARVTPVAVDRGIPSPWHPDGSGVVTGLVPLAATQLGTGSIDDDVDHLLAELAGSRFDEPANPPRHHEAG